MIYHGIKLDPFQVRAIEAIERHDTVIVAAPTGAGKTVIAEYAIERYLKEGRRIIYTGPIKALSNQKFRDFSAVWEDQIGIITGDVNLNPFAPVLIMTTEIFRNTVFDDPGRLDDVEYVILDEIHFINDAQRGTVWEESLLFAPQHIGFVCLSATVPNLTEFSDWVRSVRTGLEVTVIEETHRPVPLEQHLWLPGLGEAQVKDLRRLAAASTKRQRRLRTHEVRRLLGAGQRDPTGTGDVVAHLSSLDRMPVLYFCFSRAACENNASHYKRYNYLREDERARMLELFDTFAQQFELGDDSGRSRLRDLLTSGVCFHHAGMLPVHKEIVERLFATGLVKLLFTTETFAVGVNMPAATVVFESLEKYDGVDTRYLLTREYQQMAGRAGRRGIDEIGYVYARVDPTLLDLPSVERILTGEVEPTTSQFNLSYSSVLSLYEQFGEQIYSVCERSLANFQNLTRIRELEARRLELADQPLPTIDCLLEHPEYIALYVLARDELSRSKNRAESERQRLRKRFGGSSKQLKRHLSQLEAGQAKLARKVDESPCRACPRYAVCLSEQQQIVSQGQLIESTESNIRHLASFQRSQISRRLRLLRQNGYLDEAGLTAKGEMAAALYGFELPITELFFYGFFEDVTEEEIACLMAAIVFESKRSGWYKPLANGEMRRYLQEAEAVLRDISRDERELQIRDGVKPLDANLSSAVMAWMQGASLSALEAHSDTSDGDVVRNLRHAVDLLRQFRRVLDGHELLRGKVDRTIARLRRGAVDAERQLRLGHHLDQMARDEAQLAMDSAAPPQPEPEPG